MGSKHGHTAHFELQTSSIMVINKSAMQAQPIEILYASHQSVAARKQKRPLNQSIYAKESPHSMNGRRREVRLLWGGRRLMWWLRVVWRWRRSRVMLLRGGPRVVLLLRGRPRVVILLRGRPRVVILLRRSPRVVILLRKLERLGILLTPLLIGLEDHAGGHTKLFHKCNRGVLIGNSASVLRASHHAGYECF